MANRAFFIILRLITLTAGIFLAAYLVPSIKIDGYVPAIEAAVVLGILNISLKPVLLVLTLPITLITLGLFTIVINGCILWLAGHMVPGLSVASFPSAMLGAIIISVLSFIMNRFS